MYDSIAFRPISIEEAKQYLKKGIRSLSYSLLSKADDEEEVLNYIKRKTLVTVYLEYGRQAHAIIAREDYQSPVDVKSYVDESKNIAYLSYHQVSETILMKRAILSHDNFKKHDVLVYERLMYAIVTFGNYSFLFKSYLDAYNATSNVIIEFKTTSTFFRLDAIIDKYNYDLQAYIYQTIVFVHVQHQQQNKIQTINLSYRPINIPKFEFYFLNKVCQCEVKYVPVKSNMLASGKQKFYSNLPKIIDILVSNNYINIFQI